MEADRIFEGLPLKRIGAFDAYRFVDGDLEITARRSHRDWWSIDISCTFIHDQRVGIVLQGDTWPGVMREWRRYASPFVGADGYTAILVGRVNVAQEKAGVKWW